LKKLLIIAAISAFAASALTTGPAVSHYEGRSAKAFCKSGFVSRLSVRARKSKAKKRSRDKWVFDVSRRYGRRWSNPNFAEYHHHHCKRKHGTWRCRYSGRPCNQPSG